ncbi:LOW QUALITY PROTEIN: uncharacterized protein LOC112130763 [Pongo abelii]|uniref:LOW QUALITY PROTEIN: uncharacterized protein LOC112130763 n=1 Tax=Pongo abelii TaxID=9601 RepID=UPI0023E822FE|nr:LOW QUALITY PROTEIN: uncharacterized protein LOC112130763 [Pongo abelii]
MAFARPAPRLLQKPRETPQLRPGPEPPGGPWEAECPVGSQDGSSRSLRRLHPVREPVPTLPSRFRGRCRASAAIFGSCVRSGSTRAGMVVRVPRGPLAGSRVCHSPGRRTKTRRVNPLSPLTFSPLKSPENVNHELFLCGEFVLFCFAIGSHLVPQAGVQWCKQGSLQPRPPGAK